MARAKKIAPELAASPLYQERLKDETELRNKDVKDMSIAERLMLRTYDQRITIPLGCQKGTIKVVMRMWTQNDIDTFDAALGVMDEKTDSGKEARETVSGLLGALCVDESLSQEFWASGNWGLATFMEIRSGIMEAIATTVIDARTFRAK